MYEKFSAGFGLKNRHLQTVYASFFRKNVPIDFEVEEFVLSDGDFLECFWSYADKKEKQMPTVVLFHGLTGSYRSSYILGMIHALNSAGLNTVLMHFRGCGTKANLLPRSYHSGESGDALEFIQSLRKRNPLSDVYAVGFSLGANMLLKLLGEMAKNSLIKKAVAISAPMQLDTCANFINEGFSKIYQKRLVGDLNKSLDKKYDKHDMFSHINLKREDIVKLKTFWDFDGAYTAPVHGFKSAEDYYTKCSSRQFLKNIQTPTLIIHALDDPFMSSDVIPNENELSPFITLEVSQNGGHVGFVGGSIFKPEYWLEKRAIRFFS
ncbi:hydrolase [Sulfurimonas aquatica]|uniref:Hydrolase n=1 Tax=Sulfurimonas aquatica TaxID=2672570 RepID=A0A975GBU5_9BACT|nr:hydrolase [Sulfurimonas aquatica]QSZ40584.1 hydrolase [Sulfurimonas aquatica]